MQGEEMKGTEKKRDRQCECECGGEQRKSVNTNQARCEGILHQLLSIIQLICLCDPYLHNTAASVICFISTAFSSPHALDSSIHGAPMSGVGGRGCFWKMCVDKVGTGGSFQSIS